MVEIKPPTDTPLEIPQEVIPLKFPRPLWVALGIVAMLGVRVFLLPLAPTSRLGGWFGNPTRVVRSTGQPHQLNRMNVQFDLPSEWTYLSTVDDAWAIAPTFLHTTDQVIVRLQRASFHLDQPSLPATHSPTSQTRPAQTHPAQIQPTQRLQWIHRPSEFTLAVQVEGLAPIHLGWEISPLKRTARWSGQSGDFLLEMIDLKHRPEMPPSVQRLLNQIKSRPIE